MAVTVHELAVAWGAQPDERGAYRGSEYIGRGLPLLAGCELCGASLAPYNSFPSRSGFIRCGDCVGSRGFATVAEFEAWEQAGERHHRTPTRPLEGSDPASWYTYPGGSDE